MKGAEVLLHSLRASGVDTCFMNPGTSEMHFVAALDSVPEIRPVLGLFEGVVTGAADGYGRMAGRPAATLLHLGPGLANGLANLHNARRAATPVVNIVGDHATYHKQYDAPLESDIESLARPMSGWYRRTATAGALGRDTTEAVAAALGPPGRVATLVLPADVSWDEAGEADHTSQAGDAGQAGEAGEAGHAGQAGDGGEAGEAREERRGSTSPPLPAAARGRQPEDARIEDVAKALSSGEPAALLLGGAAVRAAEGLLAASRLAEHCGARMLAETFPGRLQRGAGLPAVERLAYLGEFAQAQLAGLSHLVLVDAKAPVSAFAYPGRPSDLVPEGCQVHLLAGGEDDASAALSALCERLDVPAGGARLVAPARPGIPSGPLDGAAVAAVVGALLPEGAIVSDEAITAGIYLPAATEGAPPHDWLSVSGNAIGQGLPVATGAAVACPDRPVIALEADGSAMYTLQALWTQAREGLDVTTILLDNGSYAILNMELDRVGATAGGPRARSMLEIDRPDIDFAGLAESLGVPASRPETTDELATALSGALAEPGPHLIQVRLPRHVI